MSSPIAKERTDPPSPKRQKTEETSCDLSNSNEYDSDDITDEELERHNQELSKCGGFEIDFSKRRYYFGWQPLDLEDSTMVDEPETNRDFVAMLANVALTKHNAETKSSLELGKILRANFHLSAGATFYISLEVKDPNSEDANQTKPYRAAVRNLAGEKRMPLCKAFEFEYTNSQKFTLIGDLSRSLRFFFRLVLEVRYCRQEHQNV